MSKFYRLGNTIFDPKKFIRFELHKDSIYGYADGSCHEISFIEQFENEKETKTRFGFLMNDLECLYRRENE